MAELLEGHWVKVNDAEHYMGRYGENGPWVTTRIRLTKPVISVKGNLVFSGEIASVEQARAVIKELMGDRYYSEDYIAEWATPANLMMTYIEARVYLDKLAAENS